MRLLSLTISLFIAVGLQGCALRAGRPALSSQLLASTDELVVQGMGGWRAGSFNLDGIPGVFWRRADRQGILDPLIVNQRGGGSFSLGPSHLTPAIEGHCFYAQSDVNVGSISVTEGRLTYRCRFNRAGRPVAAELVLYDLAGAFGTLHGRAERSGWLDYDGQRYLIRSVHSDEAGGLPSPNPLGYSIGTGQTQVGAISLNGTRKVIYAPRTQPLREATIAAGLALSIFWDPASL
jgi:hypothetical protein